MLKEHLKTDYEKNEFKKILQTFNKLTIEFQRVQELAVQKSIEFVTKAKALNNQRENQENIPLLRAQEDQSQLHQTFSNSTLQRQEQQSLSSLSASSEQYLASIQKEIEYNQAIIIDRRHGIAEIEASMQEVNEIFRDLGALTWQQQGYLDNIEANLENTAIRTFRADQELLVSRERQRRTRRSCYSIAFIVFICFLIVVLIISI